MKSNRGVEFRKWANRVLRQYILQGYAVNERRINQLGEVVRLMKRTQDSLDSKQVLSVIERYSTALSMLDAYDHQSLQRPKGSDAAYIDSIKTLMRDEGICSFYPAWDQVYSAEEMKEKLEEAEELIVWKGFLLRRQCGDWTRFTY